MTQIVGVFNFLQFKKVRGLENSPMHESFHESGPRNCETLQFKTCANPMLSVGKLAKSACESSVPAEFTRMKISVTVSMSRSSSLEPSRTAMRVSSGSTELMIIFRTMGSIFLEVWAERVGLFLRWTNQWGQVTEIEPATTGLKAFRGNYSPLTCHWV